MISLHFRSEVDPEEYLVAQECARPFGIGAHRTRTTLPRGLCVSRYTVLPLATEYYRDLGVIGVTPLNSLTQHQYCANAEQWASDLKELTPEVRSNWIDLPEGAYVLKGRTNSRKMNWATHMYAPTKADVPLVASRLLEDSMMQDQGILVRPYVPLRKLGEAIGGLPISNEWRFFLLDGEILCYGFYWGIAEDLAPYSVPPDACWHIVQKASERIRGSVRFAAIDLAETQAGDWIVIEINDGQQSGLGCCDPRAFYQHLFSRLTE